MIDAYPETDRCGVFFLVAILTGVLTVLPAQTEPGRVAPIRDVYVLFIVIDGVPGAIFDEMLNELLAEIAAAATGDELIGLSDGERELKEAFKRDRGNVRLVLVLSPT